MFMFMLIKRVMFEAGHHLRCLCIALYFSVELTRCFCCISAALCVVGVLASVRSRYKSGWRSEELSSLPLTDVMQAQEYLMRGKALIQLHQ